MRCCLSEKYDVVSITNASGESGGPKTDSKACIYGENAIYNPQDLS